MSDDLRVPARVSATHDALGRPLAQVDLDEEAAALAAVRRDPMRPARAQAVLGGVAMLLGLLVALFATPPLDGHTLLAVLLVAGGGWAWVRGVHTLALLAYGDDDEGAPWPTD